MPNHFINFSAIDKKLIVQLWWYKIQNKLLQSCVKSIVEWFEIQSVKKKQKNLYRNKKIDCFCTDHVQNNINCFYVKIQSLFSVRYSTLNINGNWQTYVFKTFCRYNILNWFFKFWVLIYSQVTGGTFGYYRCVHTLVDFITIVWQEETVTGLTSIRAYCRLRSVTPKMNGTKLVTNKHAETPRKYVLIFRL